MWKTITDRKMKWNLKARVIHNNMDLDGVYIRNGESEYYVNINQNVYEYRRIEA